MNFFPTGFNPYYQQLQQQQQQPSGFIHVQTEAQAREWSVAPGNSMTFIDDNAPFVYTKSQGMSQFDAPVFRRFRLVDETNAQSAQKPQEQPSPADKDKLPEYITKAEFEPYKAIIERIEKELTGNEQPIE